MPTKLYFHNAINDLSGTFPSGEQSSVTPAWTVTGGTTLLKMDQTIGVSESSRNANTVATLAAQDGLLGMWVSRPLSGAQTVGGGTMTLNVADSESNLDANFWVNSLNIYVWRPSTGAMVGTVRDAAGTSLGGSEGGISITVTHITGITTSAVSAADGDVIVCEVWSRHTQGVASSYQVAMSFDGTVENTTENAASGDHASFIEMAEALVFQELIVLSRTDTLTPAVSEGVALLSGVVSADTLTPSVVDARALLALLARADTLMPVVADARALLALLARADTLMPVVADASALLALLAGTDALTPALVEVGSAAVVVVGADTLTPVVADSGAVMALLVLGDVLAPSLGEAVWPDLPGMVLRALTVTLKAADGTPQVGATVRALRVRPGGGLRTVISAGCWGDACVARTAVTNGDGVAVLTLLPSFGDAYRIFAMAADGRALLDVAVLLDGDANLHELTPLEGMTWH